MKLFLYCGNCKAMHSASLEPRFDPVLGDRTLHHCPLCGRLLGIVHFDTEELPGAPR